MEVAVKIYQTSIAGIFPKHYIFDRFVTGVDLSSGLFDFIQGEQKDLPPGLI